MIKQIGPKRFRAVSFPFSITFLIFVMGFALLVLNLYLFRQAGLDSGQRKKLGIGFWQQIPNYKTEVVLKFNGGL